MICFFYFQSVFILWPFFSIPFSIFPYSKLHPLLHVFSFPFLSSISIHFRSFLLSFTLFCFPLSSFFHSLLFSTFFFTPFNTGPFFFFFNLLSPSLLFNVFYNLSIHFFLSSIFHYLFLLLLCTLFSLSFLVNILPFSNLSRCSSLSLSLSLSPVFHFYDILDIIIYFCFSLSSRLQSLS